MKTQNRLFAGVPLIEDPLFDPDDNVHDLSQCERQIARSLQINGFAVIDFPDPELEARIARIRRNLAPHLQIDLEDRQSDKTQGPGRVQDAWQFDADVQAIATNPSMLSLLSRLYGRKAFPFQTLNFPVGTQQGAHCDAVHFSCIPERFMCGVWLAMEDIGPDNGPLFYVPGSHAWPIVTNAMIARRGYGSTLASAQDPFEPAWQALQDVHESRQETFHARKGQALIWCANLLHGGSQLHDKRLTRWSQVTHYFFDDCIYYTPAFSDEALGQLALRAPVDICSGHHRSNSYLGEPMLGSEKYTPSPHRSLKARLRRFLSLRRNKR